MPVTYSVVPVMATGDWITAGWVNTYIGDNMTAIWRGTAAGDMEYYISAVEKQRLAIGGLGSILRSTGSSPAWLPSPATRSLLTHNVTNPAWFAMGSALQYLRVNAAGANFEWADDSAVGAHVARVTNQSISNNLLTAIVFDTELWDSGSVWTTGGNASKLFVPQTGKYLVTGTLGWEANATGYRECRIRINAGTYLTYNSCVPISGWMTRQTIVLPPHQFTAGDYLEMEGYQNSGGNLNALASEARLSILYLGA